jgi:anaerobic selenocysteine-containing dehydrogenase
MGMKDRTESSTRHEGAKARRDDRRTLLKAGLFAAVGLGAAPLLRGLARGSRAATTAVPPPDSTRSTGPHDPGVGELARAGLSGYLGLNAAERVAVASSCLLCAAVCGIIGYHERGRIVKVEGNPDCPNNRGMICGKGQAGVNQVHDPDRLLHPLVRVGKRGEGRWKRLPMDEALELIAFGGTIAGRQVQGLKSLYESGKPEEFMLHCGDGRLGNALEHFMKTAFGSGTISRETSLRDTAKRLGDELTIGASRDVNDVANSRYVLLFGANVLEAHPGHAHLAQRLIEAKAAGAKLVTFDVRLSNTAAMSDEWIAIRPGTDLAVILAMTNVILNEPAAVGSPLMDEAFLATWSNVTADELRGHYARYTPEWAEKESGVPAEAIRRIALEFASRRPGTVVTSGGLVGHYNGAYAEWAAKTAARPPRRAARARMPTQTRWPSSARSTCAGPGRSTFSTANACTCPRTGPRSGCSS